MRRCRKRRGGKVERRWLTSLPGALFEFLLRTLTQRRGQPLLIEISLDELLDQVARVLQGLALVPRGFIPLSVLKKLSQLELSRGFAGQLMLETISCLLETTTNSGEAYGMAPGE